MYEDGGILSEVKNENVEDDENTNAVDGERESLPKDCDVHVECSENDEVRIISERGPTKGPKRTQRKLCFSPAEKDVILENEMLTIHQHGTKSTA